MRIYIVELFKSFSVIPLREKRIDNSIQGYSMFSIHKSFGLCHSDHTQTLEHAEKTEIS